jgi:hypothetical protein
MTPTRMRQIAERLETLCAELRMHIEESDGLRKACDGCLADAREMRDLANSLEKVNNHNIYPFGLHARGIQ